MSRRAELRRKWSEENRQRQRQNRAPVPWKQWAPLATGGVVDRTKVNLVSETGPELVDLPKGTRIERQA